MTDNLNTPATLIDTLPLETLDSDIVENPAIGRPVRCETGPLTDIHGMVAGEANAPDLRAIAKLEQP
jgi:hypothetical protein